MANIEVSDGQREKTIEEIIAQVKQVGDRAARDRADVRRYVLTYRAPTDAVRRMIEREVRRLGDDDLRVREKATMALLEEGYPAYIALSELKTDDAETNARAGEILERLCSIHEIVERQGLDHHVCYLTELAGHEDAVVRDAACRRLESILPAAAASPDKWRENRKGFRWDSTLQRFVPR